MTNADPVDEILGEDDDDDDDEENILLPEEEEDDENILLPVECNLDEEGGGAGDGEACILLPEEGVFATAGGLDSIVSARGSRSVI